MGENNQPNPAQAERQRLFAALAGQQTVLEKVVAELKETKRVNAVLSRQVAFIGKIAGIEGHLAKLVTADDQNPAQPVPGGGTEAPAVTTEEARQPDTTDSLTNQGGTPGSDTAADATTSLDTQQTVLDVPLDLNEQDVTKAVPSVQTPPSGEQAHAPVDVQVGTPSDNTNPAFPWTMSSARFIAALRLARLRIQAGMDAGPDDIALAQAIASDQKVSDALLDHELGILTQAMQARSANRQQQGGQPQRVARRLVPQAAEGVARTTPSMASGPTGFRATASASDDDAEFWLDGGPELPGE